MSRRTGIATQFEFSEPFGRATVLMLSMLAKVRALSAAWSWMVLCVAFACGGGESPSEGGERDAAAPSDAAPSASGGTGTSTSGGTGGRGGSGGNDAATGGTPVDAGDSGGTGGEATPPDASDDPFQVQWAEPAPNAVVLGTQRFRLVGRGFLNVEIQRNGATIATCDVSPDHTSATADIDTTSLPNGPVTLTARAWDVPAGEQATQFEDAGPLSIVVDNPGTPTLSTLEPYGVGSHWNEVPMFADMHEAGVQWLRMDISWRDVQASNGGFNWTNVDAAMTEAAKHELKVLAVLGYTNDWATSKTGGAGDAHQYAPREEFDDEFGHYVQETVSRYGAQVAAWEIWNEPDHDNFLRIGEGTWAGNHHPNESAVNKKRLEYKHLLEIAMAQPALADKYVTTSGFAEGGGWDTGMRGWLASQSGFLNQFDVASFHTYGYPSYQRLVDVTASYRATQSAIAKPAWPFWITEHGINTTGVASGQVKTYLIRSFAIALAQQGVEKLFWFRAGYDPGHMDLFDSSRGRTAAYDAYKTLTGKWVEPTSIAAWTSNATARGSIASLASGKRVAIVWNDTGTVSLNTLGLSFDAAYDQNGGSVAANASLGAAPVFLALSD